MRALGVESGSNLEALPLVLGAMMMVLQDAETMVGFRGATLGLFSGWTTRDEAWQLKSTPLDTLLAAAPAVCEK